MRCDRIIAMDKKYKKGVVIGCVLITLLIAGNFLLGAVIIPPFTVKDFIVESFPGYCDSVEERLEVPTMLSEGNVEVTQKADIILNDKSSASKCSPILSALDGNIIGTGKDDFGVWKQYAERDGKQVIALSIGQKFKVTGVVSVTYHGVRTIESYAGPIDYLILSNDEGKNYSQQIASLGLNKDSLFLKFVTATRTQVLESVNFRDYRDRGKLPFTFTDRSLYQENQ